MPDQQASDPVLMEVSDGIAILTLNRPERGNGWTSGMSQRYFALLLEAARSPEIRAVLVTGAGSAFCVGGDSEVLGEVSRGEKVKQDDAPPADHLLAMKLGKPVIAAINGACFGIGMQQALCCDVRFASDNAKFSTAFARRGLAAEMGISWLLPRLVGTGHAMDLLLSARLVRAEEAERIGLVNRTLPANELLPAAKAYAVELATKCAPEAMRTIKAQLWNDMSVGMHSSYRRADGLMQATFASPDFKEGLASWQEARDPEFPPLSPDHALGDIEDG